MTEQERVDKLKARMIRWQAYVDKPQANTLPQAADAETQVGLHQSRTARKAERSQAGLSAEPTRGATSRPGDVRANAPSPDLLTDLQEARITDLKIAIAREREQADRLADEVRRAQHLHAATLYSQITDEKVRHPEPPSIQPQIPEAPPGYYDEARRKNLAVVFGFLLILTSVCVASFLITR